MPCVFAEVVPSFDVGFISHLFIPRGTASVCLCRSMAHARSCDLSSCLLAILSSLCRCIKSTSSNAIRQSINYYQSAVSPELWLIQM